MIEALLDRKDKEQVRPFLARYAELRESGLFYNDDFRGKIPGVAGRPDEDTAIYMLSVLWHVENERAEIERAFADGFWTVEPGEPGGMKRFSDVLVYRPGFYCGGTGLISRYQDARLTFDDDGQPYAILPKGRRTRGHDVRGAQVLVREMRVREMRG